MNTITPVAPENFAAELVRRGLPVEYAERVAAELVDHRHDLLGELRAAGLDEDAAVAEAARRLGDDRQLVKKTVREYQARYWTGRWPLLSFVLAPLPAVMLGWFVAGHAMVQLYEFSAWVGQRLGFAAPTLGTIATLKWILLGGSMAALVPLLLTALFYWLAQRAGCDRRWALVSSGQIAFLASLLCFQLDVQNGRLFCDLAMLGDLFYAATLTEFLRSYFVQPSQAVQLALPLAAFASLVWIERRARRMRQILADC